MGSGSGEPRSEPGVARCWSTAIDWSVNPRTVVLVVCLSGVLPVVRCALQPAQAATPPVDASLLEFLGSVDSDDQEWHEYLASSVEPQALRAVRRDPPPPGSSTPAQRPGPAQPGASSGTANPAARGGNASGGAGNPVGSTDSNAAPPTGASRSGSSASGNNGAQSGTGGTRTDAGDSSAGDSSTSPRAAATAGRTRSSSMAAASDAPSLPSEVRPI
jgi:hypothetical protein